MLEIMVEYLWDGCQRPPWRVLNISNRIFSVRDPRHVDGAELGRVLEYLCIMG